MKDQKGYRLLLGLIILSSIFLFQGSEGHHACTQCENENFGGSLTVINNSVPLATVYVLPDYTTAANLQYGESKVFYLDEGLYQVMAIRTYVILPEEILLVRMVEIKVGSNKTVEII